METTMARGRSSDNFKAAASSRVNRAGMMLVGNTDDLGKQEEADYDSIATLPTQEQEAEEADLTLEAAEDQQPEQQHVEQPEDTQPEVNEQPLEVQIPDKFQKAEKVDVIKAYSELEKELGRLRNENGEFKKTFDKLVTQGAKPAQYPANQPTPEQVEKMNAELLNQMLSNPTQFVQSLQNQIVGGVQNVLRQQTVQQAVQSKAHVLNDPAFRNWLVENVPLSVAEQADSDPATLDFIVNQFQSVTGVRGQSQIQPPTQPQRQLPPNITSRPTGVAAGTNSQSRAQNSQKVWTRTEIRGLLSRNPDKYQEMVGEIQRAYMEGRVRDQ